MNKAEEVITDFLKSELTYFHITDAKGNIVPQTPTKIRVSNYLFVNHHGDLVRAVHKVLGGIQIVKMSPDEIIATSSPYKFTYETIVNPLFPWGPHHFEGRARAIPPYMLRKHTKRLIQGMQACLLFRDLGHGRPMMHSDAYHQYGSEAIEYLEGVGLIKSYLDNSAAALSTDEGIVYIEGMSNKDFDYLGRATIMQDGKAVDAYDFRIYDQPLTLSEDFLYPTKAKDIVRLLVEDR